MNQHSNNLAATTSLGITAASIVAAVVLLLDPAIGPGLPHLALVAPVLLPAVLLTVVCCITGRRAR